MTITFGIFVAFITVILAVGGQILVRFFFKQDELKQHHDVADPLMSIVGTLFAVLLGFMVANAMQRFEEARINVQQEANAVMDLYHLAEGLPQPDSQRLRKHIKTYVDVVIADEWPKMAHKEASEVASKTSDQIWTDCSTFKPKEDAHNNLQQRMLDSVSSFSDCRRMRLYAMHNGLPRVLWLVLLAGGIVTITFTYFFGIKNARLQLVMTAIVSLAICLNLFLLASFDDPFSGDVMVNPVAFEIDQKTMDANP